MKRLALQSLHLLSRRAARRTGRSSAPAASGVAEGHTTPATWDAAKSANLRWKTPIPGLAHSSPVVWGNRVFVTTAVSANPKPEARFGLYGDVDPVKDVSKHTWKVYAVDKQTGKILGTCRLLGIPK